MHCPFCQAEDTKVIDSRLVADGSQTRRRRECQKCKNVFTCKPQFRDNPTCLECLRNTKH